MDLKKNRDAIEFPNLGELETIKPNNIHEYLRPKLRFGCACRLNQSPQAKLQI